ncbi:MAG: integrase [Hyphomicrobium sp.]|nr:MAG: integrase [Hyphomicrobium sp.]
MMGTDLQVIHPTRSQIEGGNAERMPSLQTSANTDLDLLAVWIKVHADGSPHTRRAYGRIGRRFVDALGRAGRGMKRATVDDVQAALETMRLKEDGSPASVATVNTTIAAVKALLGFAHQVGYARFNAAPLIKLRKAPRQLAQRIMSEFDTLSILRAAKPGRERILCEVAYFGGLRVSELSSLTWSQTIPRDSGELQLALVGKGDKSRHVLLPADTAKGLLAMRGHAPQTARVFAITERRINYILKAIVKRAGGNPSASPHWLRHAHASHAIDNGAPITLVSQTLGHADLKTTSVYAHARPNESSSRYLKCK